MKAYILAVLATISILATAQTGKTTVDGVTDLMDDDEEMYFTLDSCETIDKKLTKRVTRLLKQELATKENEGALYAQAIVLDARTGDIKSWVALEDEAGTGSFGIARPREFQCSAIPMKLLLATMAMADANLTWEDSVDTKCGIDTIDGLVIKDPNWTSGGYGNTTYREAFRNHSDIAMAKAMFIADSVRFRNEWLYVTDSPRALSAYSIASMYNVVDGESAYFSLATNCDTVAVVMDEGATLTERQSSMCMEILKATLQEGGMGSQWATSKVDMSGDYSVHRGCKPTVYDGNVGGSDRYYNDNKTETYNQVIFSGYLPSDNPRYAICVTMDKKGDECSGKDISKTVNKIAEYLNKHMKFQ